MVEPERGEAGGTRGRGTGTSPIGMTAGGKIVIRAPVEAVYAGLFDAKVLEVCIPCAFCVAGSAEDGFEVAIAPWPARSGRTGRGLVVMITYPEWTPLKSVTLDAVALAGKGRTVTGALQVRLAPGRRGGVAVTMLEWHARGLVAGMPDRLMPERMAPVAMRLAVWIFLRRFRQSMERGTSGSGSTGHDLPFREGLSKKHSRHQK